MEIQNIIEHYEKKYIPKVFMTRLISSSKSAYLMYIYQYEKELDNFAETFLVYLPFYVRAEDYFSALNESLDLDEQLIERSKCLRKNSKVVPNRPIESNGIYGELFLDFYLRIINAKKSILTYANKRSFDSDLETTGPDNVVYYIDFNDKINLCLCEAKFVAGAGTAKNKLIEDIVGTPTKEGHITKQYLNDYFQFIVEKGVNMGDSDRKIFEPFLSDLNAQLDNGNDFISIVIDYNVCVNFIFFAIFDSTRKQPELMSTHYNEIYNQCESNVKEIGIKNYKIEIVFIPTDNNTMTIKREIEKAYEEN